ncbi:MAG: hypothetical protein PVG39_02070 [Desulfobacteraceae bacterium]|jgi:hypothetical protein
MELNQQQIQTLMEFSELEGSEVGELGLLLVRLFDGYRSYCSDEFVEALNKEMFVMLEWFQGSCKIVEKQETITYKGLECL